LGLLTGSNKSNDFHKKKKVEIVIPLALKVLYALGVFLVWIIGILKAFSGDYWKPPIIHETSEWLRRALRL